MTLDSIAYTMTPHDRMPGRRSDPHWVATQRGRPNTQVIPLWRDRCVLASNCRPMRLNGAEGQAAAEGAVQTVLLGMDGPTAVFAADLDHAGEASALRVCGASGTAEWVG